MPSRPRVHLHRIEDASVLGLPRDVVADAEQALLAAADQALSPRPRLMVLDFTQVLYINSAGIGALVLVLQKTQESGVPVAMAAVDEAIQPILGRVGVTRTARLCDSVREALDGEPA